MWTAIDWWEQASLEARQRLCDRLGWPQQYAEGEANHEWLTAEQIKQLRAVDLRWLDEIDAESARQLRGEETTTWGGARPGAGRPTSK